MSEESKQASPAEPFATDRASLERESEVTFFTASGPGGQHRNRSRTGVRIHHFGSGLTVTATERRSQSQNLEIAFQRLEEKLTQLNIKPKKRRATRPTRSSQRRRLQEKTKQANKKQMRKKPKPED